MLTFDQILVLFDKVGLCGLTFLLLVVHMSVEERTRRRLAHRLKKIAEQEGQDD